MLFVGVAKRSKSILSPGGALLDPTQELDFNVTSKCVLGALFIMSAGLHDCFVTKASNLPSNVAFFLT